MMLRKSQTGWGWILRTGVVAAAVTYLTAACTTTTAVSTTNIPRERSRPVSASTKRWVILGLVFDNDEVLTLPDRLRERCPSGAVRGITSHHATTNYFLGLVMTRQVQAQGFCVKDRVADQGTLEDSVYAEGESLDGSQEEEVL